MKTMFLLSLLMLCGCCKKSKWDEYLKTANVTSIGEPGVDYTLIELHPEKRPKPVVDSVAPEFFCRSISPAMKRDVLATIVGNPRIRFTGHVDIVGNEAKVSHYKCIVVK